MEPGAPMYNKTIKRSSIMEVKVQTEQEEGTCYYICIVHVHTLLPAAVCCWYHTNFHDYDMEVR